MNFCDLGVEKELATSIEALGFHSPMPIQEKVIPFLLEKNNKDLIAIAQTGTGKTAAFGLPIVQNTVIDKKYPQYLILSPTRELCLQIADDLSEFAKVNSKLKVGALFGGSSIEQQVKMLKKGVHVISATPGRLVDLLNRGKADISKIKAVVLDEADEMLNMGFREELEAILEATPKNKTTLLFSATMPAQVLKMTKKYMSQPEEISVGRKNVGAENIQHICYMVQAKERYLALKRITDYNPDVYGIVFCRTRKETQEIADKLIKDGYNADSLHGDLSQAQRDLVMNKFRIKHLKILVATDVAARGLDVDDLTHVINYNLPDEEEIYTHRSGRTGRAGKSGISVIIANMREKSKIISIEKKIGKKIEFKKVPQGKEVCERQLFHLIDRMEKVEVDYSEIEQYLPKIFKKLEWLDREELIKKFVSVEFNRFLAYYKGAKDLSISLDKTGKKAGSNANFTRFFINLGRRDGLKPVTIIKLVNEFTRQSDIELGDIEILQNFSFFEADVEFTDLIISSINNQLFNKRKISIEVAANAKRSNGKDKSQFKGKRRGSKDRDKKIGRHSKRRGPRD